MKRLVFLLTFLALFSSTPVLASTGDRVQLMGDIVISQDERVIGDVVAVMGDVLIEGAVEGNVVAVMGNVDVHGEVRGDAICVLGNCVVNGEVFGTVTIAGGNITEGAAGKIHGDTNYIGMGEGLSRFTHRYVVPKSTAKRAYVYSAPNGIFRVMRFIGTWVMAVLLITLFPGGTNSATNRFGEGVLKTGGIGFLCLLSLPVLMLMMVISIFGIPLVPILIFLLFAAGFFGYVVVSTFLGRKLHGHFHLRESALVDYSLGAISLWLIQFVPFFGALTSAAVFIFALGIAVESRFGTKNVA